LVVRSPQTVTLAAFSRKLLPFAALTLAVAVPSSGVGTRALSRSARQ
jgi:hypothetical protein